jgi:hypothetical protein
MATPQKFTEEELKEIKELRDQNQVKVQEFGRLEMELLLGKQHWENLIKEKEKVTKEYEDIQTQEKALVEKLNKKYGSGVVDITSGNFTPSN